MTATRPRRHGKRAFLALLFILAAQGRADDAGWRLTIVPSFESAPPVNRPIPGSRTARLAVARHAGHGELEYATTQGALRHAQDLAAAHTREWIAAAKVEERRDADGVITRVVITSDDPLLPAIAASPGLYDRYEPVLGDGFYVVVPDRGTIALYPRLAAEGIPPRDATALLEVNRLATYPVSREVFRATRRGLVADGVLTED
ncbi:MAG: hypothetical protein ACO3G9_08730 [Chthoniobacterales bacterium]|jgi:hypothetical protein